MTIKRLLRQCSVLMLCVLFTQIAFSQTKTISGKISDDKGNPVQGATVTVRGVRAGTSTDAAGMFKLSVPATAKTLVISNVGFAQQEISIGGKESFDVSLVPSTSTLNDVVVVGYGTSQRRDITGSVASVKAKDFNKGAVSADELLIGKVPGLQIADNSGQPGGTVITKIRGNNSIVSGNNPLYVIDGVPLDATSPIPPNLMQGTGTIPSNNPLLFLNPGDIASIDVLKDASSAAIYGARGENGVILITTNKGNGKFSIDAGVTLSTYAGVMKQPDILSASQYRSEIAKYGFTTDSGQNINAFNAILQNKLSTVYSVALSGGGENGKYRASFSASDKQGIILKSGLQQYNANFSGEQSFLDRRLKINFNVIASSYTLQTAPISTNAGSQGNEISAAMNWNPTLALVENGVYNQTNPSGQINPVALANYWDDYSHVTQILANTGVSFKIANGFYYNFLYGLNYGISTRDAQLQGNIKGTGSSADGAGSAETGNGSLFSQTITHTLNWEKKLSDGLKFKLLAGYEYWSTTNGRYDVTYGYGFSWNIPGGAQNSIPYYNDMQGMKQANLTTASSIPPTTELQAYFGRAEVNYKEKYFLTGTIRADGSSKFGVNNKYGYFPSFGFRWDALQEDFLKDNKIFNALSLRVGYGQTGGQDGLPPGASKQLAYYSSYGGQTTLNFPNPNLKWETLASTDAGLDFGILQNRVFGSFDYFNKKTTNALFPGTLSIPSAGATIWENLPGYISNKGFEFGLTFNIIRSKDITWNINVSYTHVVNKFVYPALGSSPLFLTGGVNGQGVSSAYAEAIANGQPIDAYYLRQFQGFDQNGIAIVKSQASSYSGDPNPHSILGLNTDVTYKKLSLAINSHGQFGYQIFNNTLVSVTNLGNIANGKNISKTLIGTSEGLANPVSASTRFLQSGNFVKIGNITLAYNLGSFGNAIKTARVFVTCNNLIEFTKYTGFDAEVNQDHSNGGIPSLGMDYIGYPTARSISFGLNFSLY